VIKNKIAPQGEARYEIDIARRFVMQELGEYLAFAKRTVPDASGKQVTPIRSNVVRMRITE
jgi:hypothetical protein